jgi:hypothetical protein
LNVKGEGSDSYHISIKVFVSVSDYFSSCVSFEWRVSLNFFFVASSFSPIFFHKIKCMIYVGLACADVLIVDKLDFFMYSMTNF